MNPLFYNSILIFSNEDMKKLENAKVSVAGIGGVGSIATEMLIRTGINNFNLADLDVYVENNMNRQIYATHDTIGKNKAAVAKERALSINPNCNVKTYTNGVNLDNVYEFCENSDVILSLNDTESIKVLIHKVAKELGVPVIMGSRKSINSASRWCVRGRLWDYKNNKDLPTFGHTNHPELDKYSVKEMTPKMLYDYDEMIKKKKIATFMSFAKDEENDYFNTIPKAELKEKLENNPDSYNRHVCSVIANIGGSLAATLAIRYIIGKPTETLQIDLMQD